MDGCCVSKSKAIFIIFNPITHTFILLLKTHKSLFSQGPEVNASCVCVCIYSHIKRYVLFDKFATGGTDAPDGQKIPNSTNTLFFFSFSFFFIYQIPRNRWAFSLWPINSNTHLKRQCNFKREKDYIETNKSA